ncbi:MAG: carbohydrate ABC transporter substrate-binding protein [Anaerolineae bacterium]|nr:carbohydrate ABC transporter substrate-binding protein [Anaerolineae bacterium]
MKSKRALLITLLILVAMVLPSAAVFSQDETVELRMAWWGSQTRHDKTIAVIELYETLNPNVDIVYEPSGWDDHWTKLATQAAGGDLPDIIQHDYQRIREWVANDLLLPLDEFIESGVIDTTNIADASLAGGIVDGKLYGFNLGNNSETFVIDVDALEAAGVELPPVDWTWADFEEMALKLAASGVYAAGGNLHFSEHWKGLYISCCDSYAYNAEGNGLGYTEEEDQYFVDYLNMLLRLQDAGAIPTLEETTANANTSVEDSYIVTGQAAIEYGWSNMIVAIWTAAGEDRNFIEWTVPRVVDGLPRNYIKPSMFFAISKDSDKAEEAAKFIDFFTNSIEANEILFAERGVPVSSAVREALSSQLGPAQQEMFDFLGVVEGYNSPIRPPDPAAHADINSNVYLPQVVEPILYGMMSPEEGVKILRDEAELLLSQ